jgi:hypothetical protein
MLSVILTAISILIFAFFNASLTLFLQFCFQRGSIFSGWLPWVAKIIVKKEARWKYDEIKKLADKFHRENEYLKACFETKLVFLWKIIGGCSVCSGTWLAIGTFIILFFTLPFQWYWVFPYIFVSGLFTLLLEKHDNSTD